jgi:hypothetical protein
MKNFKMPPNMANQLSDFPKERAPLHWMVNYCMEDSRGRGPGVGEPYPLAFNMDGMFSCVIPGDVVWLVGCRNGRGELSCRFVVSEVLELQEATRRTKQKLFLSDHYLWADDAVRTALVMIDITAIVAKLTFDDGLLPRAIEPQADGLFMVRDFWQIRILNALSIAMLEEAYLIGTL